jgi:hypothetical protein
MTLLYEPRGRRLTLDGASARWEAFWFDRDNTRSAYELHFFAPDVQVWLTRGAAARLRDSRKRKPFPVPADLILPGRPPGRLMCAGQMCSGLTDAEERVRTSITGIGA